VTRGALAAGAIVMSRAESACPTRGSNPCINPNFCQLCADADRRKARGDAHLAFLRSLMPDEVSLDRAWDEINRAARERYNAAPKPTVEAPMYSLRERGVRALEEPNTLRRLSELSEAQIKEVCRRIQNFKPEIERPWSPDDVATLIVKWRKLHE